MIARFVKLKPTFHNFSKTESFSNSKDTQLDEENTEWKRDIEAYFLGPTGQNIPFFKELTLKAIDSHCLAREMNNPNLHHISQEFQNKKEFIAARDKLSTHFDRLIKDLRQLSVPFQSSRYQAHMAWDLTMPSLLGNIAAMLYNPNNGGYEGSPLTTPLEIQCMSQLASMVGYPPMSGSQEGSKPSQNLCWGHFTCGGTIANVEALWAARNAKYLPFALRQYLLSKNGLSEEVKKIMIKLVNGRDKELLQLTRWELLNCNNDEIIQLYSRVFRLIHHVKEGEEIDSSSFSEYGAQVAAYSVGKLGILDVYTQLAKVEDSEHFPMVLPKIFISATQHYSIPKANNLIGFGENSIEVVPIDENSRMDMAALNDKLSQCLDRKVPVLAVIGILGSTAESAIDPLNQILELRKKFEAKGLYFHFHIDAAYGGYYCAMLKDMKETHWNSLSQYAAKQFKMVPHSDSITLDPHKAGYVPFGAGGLLYRNQYLKNQLNFSAPYMFDGKSPNMSIYGLQGTKQGFVVAGVYLSHSVLPLNRSHHGKLLERTMINTKIFTACLYQLHKFIFNGRVFRCLLLPRKYSQKYPQTDKKLEEQTYELISKTGPTEMHKVIKGTEREQIYLELGPDINVILYGINQEGNRSLHEFNRLNRQIIQSARPSPENKDFPNIKMFLSTTEFSKKHNERLFSDFVRRHNLKEDDDRIVLVRSSIMDAFFTEIYPKDKVICLLGEIAGEALEKMKCT